MLFRSDRKSTRLNSSHLVISYAVFCLKKKKTKNITHTECDDAGVTCHMSVARTTQQTFLAAFGSVVLAVSITSMFFIFFFFFFNDTATPEIYTLSLHDALPIYNIRMVAQVDRRVVTLRML